MAKFSSPPAGPLAAGLERDFCRCRLEVLHLFENFTQGFYVSLEVWGINVERAGCGERAGAPARGAGRAILSRDL